MMAVVWIGSFQRRYCYVLVAFVSGVSCVCSLHSQHKLTDESSSSASPLKKLRRSPRKKNPERGMEPSAKGRSKKRHVDTAREAGPSADVLPQVSYPVELGYCNYDEKEVHKKRPPKVGYHL